MNDDSYRTIRNKLIIDKVLDNVQISIKTNKNFLFGFSREYDGDFSNMLNSVIYDHHISRFFKLLLAEFPRTRKETLKLPDKEKLDQFLYCLFSDIKMSLLKDALINLSSYFVENIYDRQSLDIKRELFYTEDKFKSELKRFLDKTELADLNDMTTKLEDYEHILHSKLPIISFPWYAYALCYTFSDFPSFESGKEINIVNGQHLSLNWLGRNNYPGEIDYIEMPKKKLQAFLSSLEHSNRIVAKPQYNRSLNLYLFDETTDLYYIFRRLNIFRKQYMYLYLRNNGTEGLDSRPNENKTRYNQLESQFYNSGVFANITGIGNKVFLSANINDELVYNNRKWIKRDDRQWEVQNDRVWMTYNEVFACCKRFLLKVITKEHMPEYHKVNKDIRLDYCIFRLFNDDEPYLSLLNQPLFEVSESGNDSELDDLSDHDFPLEDAKFLMNAAYYYLHKNCYEAQYKGQKLRNFVKY